MMVHHASSTQHNIIDLQWKIIITISYNEALCFGHTLEGPLTPYDLQLSHHQTRHHIAT